MKYRLDEKSVGEMIIRQMEMRLATFQRIKELTPENHREPYLEKVHDIYKAQIKTLEDAIADARALLDSLELDEN